MGAFEIAKIIAKPIIEDLYNLAKSKVNTNKDSKLKINLENHILEVLNWSQEIQFFGMSEAVSTENCTINLSYDIPRKFRSYSINKIQDEIDLLLSPNNILILGDPGSGKTTTLKRIALNLLLKEALDPVMDKYQYPILIKARDINDGNCNIFDLISSKIILLQKKSINDEKPYDYIATPKDSDFKNNCSKEDLIPQIINETGALILIDGLDEVSPNEQNLLEKSMSELALKLSNSKIIATCRSGSYTKFISRFNLCEVCPLTENQIENIINKWSTNPEEFKNGLKKFPYHDTSNRPLFLNQLIILYNNYGYFPEEPSEVYKKIIDLMLRNWDSNRDVSRKSKYSVFNPDKKLLFLSATAYHLTYKIKSKVFTSKELVKVYEMICVKFSLPREEAVMVANEIESHSGIIAKTSDNNYEFCHLSLQEYLSALYIASDPVGKQLYLYLNSYPAPVAVAIALTSYPENLMAYIFFEKQFAPLLDEKTVKIILSRLYSENPMFSPSR